MTIIKYGKIDKKLIVIIFITILLSLKLILDYKVPDEYSIKIFIDLEEEIGPIISGIIIYYIFKPKKEEKNRKSFKYIIYLFLLKVITASELIYDYSIQKEENNQIYDYESILNMINGFEFIFMTFGTFLLLKYKYYIHHYISMIIYCILGITNDIILGNYKILNYKFVYIHLIIILNDVLTYCYL